MAKKFIPFYNVEASVGQGGVNKADDVMLVQFMLSEIGSTSDHPTPPPKNKLVVDGKSGPVTIEWILWFQNNVKKRGGAITPDGRVDPAREQGGDWYHSRSPGGVGYTITHLNATYRRRFHDDHDAMEQATRCPAQLKAKFIADDVIKIAGA